MKKPVLALLSIILLTAGCSQRPAATTKIPLTSAHRGAATIAPENTMASVDSCIKYGVGNIECDVCISKDSVFYVLHDSTLDRTTNGTGAISQWLSADIDTLDAGSWFAPRFAGQRVLRLTDLLRKAKEHGLRITIDYRNGGLHQLLNLIKDEGMLENCNFTFSKEYHAKCFRKMAPEVRTLQAYIKSEKDIEHVVKELHPDIAVVWIDSLTPQFVKKCREHNLAGTGTRPGAGRQDGREPEGSRPGGRHHSDGPPGKVHHEIRETVHVRQETCRAQVSK